MYFSGSNYVLKYRFLMNFANFRIFCQIAIRRPAMGTMCNSCFHRAVLDCDAKAFLWLALAGWPFQDAL